MYEVSLSIPAGFFGETSQIHCSAIDNHMITGDSYHNISVLYVNSKPSFSIVTNLFSLPQSSLPHTISIALTDISPGAFDTGQTLQCRLFGFNMSFFALEPTILTTVLAIQSVSVDLPVSFQTKSLYTVGKTSFNVVCTDDGGTLNGGESSFSSPIFLNFTLMNFPPY
jgi:hypothetical protein